MTFFTRTALAAALLLTLAACEQITPENYAKLKNGMTKAEVHAILGKPVRVSGGGLGMLDMSVESFDGEEHQIRVTFAGDKLMMKTIGSVTDEHPEDDAK